MAARGYEFYLRVLKVYLTSERSERVRDTFSMSSVCRENFENSIKNGKLSCNGLIMLVTMATLIPSHVEEKNSIFTARDEEMIF